MEQPESFEPITAATAFESSRVYAGFWVRVFAYMIDSTILSASVFVASLLLPALDMYSLQLFAIITGIAYQVYFFTGKWQATPGKRMLGMYVIDANHGGPITALKAVARYFATILSSFLLGIGLIMVAFTREKTALHDLICSTRVLNGRK